MDKAITVVWAWVSYLNSPLQCYVSAVQQDEGVGDAFSRVFEAIQEDWGGDLSEHAHIGHSGSGPVQANMFGADSVLEQLAYADIAVVDRALPANERYRALRRLRATVSLFQRGRRYPL